MRARIAIMIGVVLLLIILGGSYTLYTLYFAPAWTVVHCPPYGCGPGPGEYIVLEGWSFPLGGPLTVALYNEGAGPENLAAAKYYICNVVNYETQYPCAQGTVIGGNCTSAVSPGTTCQVKVTVSVTGLVSGSVYPFILVTTTGGAFYNFKVMYGGEAGTITMQSQQYTSTTAPFSFSGTVKIPWSQGACGEYAVQEFNGAGGQILTGSVTASNQVGVYVLTSAEYNSWSQHFLQGMCLPPSVVSSQTGNVSYTVNTTISASGTYYFIVVNLDPALTVTIQITINLG